MSKLLGLTAVVLLGMACGDHGRGGSSAIPRSWSRESYRSSDQEDTRGFNYRSAHSALLGKGDR